MSECFACGVKQLHLQNRQCLRQFRGVGEAGRHDGQAAGDFTVGVVGRLERTLDLCGHLEGGRVLPDEAGARCLHADLFIDGAQLRHRAEYGLVAEKKAGGGQNDKGKKRDERPEHAMGPFGGLGRTGCGLGGRRGLGSFGPCVEVRERIGDAAHDGLALASLLLHDGLTAGGLLKTGVELFVWHAEAFRLVGGKACLTFRAVEHVGGEVVLDSPQGPAGGTTKNFGHGEVSQMQS